MPITYTVRGRLLWLHEHVARYQQANTVHGVVILWDRPVLRGQMSAQKKSSLESMSFGHAGKYLEWESNGVIGREYPLYYLLIDISDA